MRYDILRQSIFISFNSFGYLLEDFPSIIVAKSPEGSHPIIGTRIMVFKIEVYECYSYCLVRLSCYCPCAQGVVSVVTWIVRTCEFSSLSWNNNIRKANVISHKTDISWNCCISGPKNMHKAVNSLSYTFCTFISAILVFFTV